MKNNLTALDFWGKPVWTSGTDDERGRDGCRHHQRYH